MLVATFATGQKSLTKNYVVVSFLGCSLCERVTETGLCLL